MEIKYYDLSPAQVLLLFSQKYTIHKQVNNICTSILTDTKLDFDILRTAVQTAYRRNDSLRVRIVKVGKSVKQYFVEHEEPVVDYLDFRGRSSEEMDKALYKIAHKRITAFGRPLSKVYFINSFDGKCGIYFAVSHFILDSWGITTFYKDVLAIYEALLNGTDMPKPLASYEKLLKSELNYKNTEAYKKDLEFWQKLFDGDEPIFTHVNGSSLLEKHREKHGNPELRYSRLFTLFTKADNIMLPFPKELVSKMEAYCMENNLPMQSLVLLAFRSYLSKVNNNEKDIDMHTVVARRGTLTEKNTGGTRIHFLPLRTIIEESTTFKDACAVISENLASIYKHVSIDPLEVISIWQKKFKVPRTDSYSSASVTFQPVKLVSPNGMKLETRWYGNGASGNPLYLTVMDGDGDGSLKFYYEYQTRHISLETIQSLHSYIIAAVTVGVTHGEISIGELLKL